MASSRTRSQVTLPNSVLLALDRSPLKDARRAQSAQPSLGRNESEESEDELLLSPRKRLPHHSNIFAAQPGKRAASPALPSEEYKDLKRAKHSHDLTVEGENAGTTQRHAALGHSRTSSDPNTSIPPLYPAPAPQNRARSLPSSLPPPGPAPFVDLANPPPSPQKASPMKSSQIRPTLGLPSREFGGNLEQVQEGESCHTPPTNEMSSHDQAVPKPGLRTIPEDASIPSLHAKSGPTFADRMGALSPLTPLVETPLPQARAGRPMKPIKAVSIMTLRVLIMLT